MKRNWQIFLGAFTFFLFYYIARADGVGCFVCTSINNSTPSCEDTFNNSNSQKYYTPNCKAGRKGRTGLFPATSCVKLKAEMPDTGYRVLVRACVVDNGDINSETEIGRSNHCGIVDRMIYDSKKVKGCILSCYSDGCNSAPGGSRISTHIIHIPILTALLLWLNRIRTLCTI